MFLGNKIVLIGEKIDIEGFRDYDVVGICGGGGEGYVGIPQYTYDHLLDISGNVKFIIVDDNWDFETLYEFNILMSKLGFRVGVDYIFHSMLRTKINTNKIYKLLSCSKEEFLFLMDKIIDNKELIIVHGNCQAHVLINMLSSDDEFRKRYLLCEMPRLWQTEDIEEYNILFETEILRRAVYLFTQEVSIENRFGYIVSSEYMISQVSSKCMVVVLPNLYFMGYFPQFKRYDQEVVADLWMDSKKGRKFGCYKGEIEVEVLKLILQGKDDGEIIDMISRDDFYSYEFLQKNIEIELEEYKQRESSVDIKMADFLLENYNKFLMFATANHPTRGVMMELTKRVLNKLGIYNDNIQCDANEIQLPCDQNSYTVIYPSVLSAFGFKERMYCFRAFLYGGELPILLGINDELDAFINDNRSENDTEYNIDMSLEFIDYMKIYIRVLRSVIHM